MNTITVGRQESQVNNDETNKTSWALNYYCNSGVI